MKWFITDAIGPFFSGYDRKRINWSKIPFERFERNGGPGAAEQERIAADFARFVEAASAMGFNAVTLDDLAHLTDCPFYRPSLRSMLSAFERLYRRLFASASDRGMKVFITTDIMFYNVVLLRRLGTNPAKVAEFLAEATDRLFRRFPEVAGVVFRMGESDGVDVEGEFRSRLVLRAPAQARALVQALLPVFERHQRLLVFRTWSVGAHRIGDLMWNPATYHKVFHGLDSEQLLVSMKHGESDFFRYLEPNPLLFEGPQKKIVELQARREYEGFGEFPSFIGWEHEALRDRLAAYPQCVGIQVWCQTGGWTRFRRLTFLDRSSVWNEINAQVTVRMFREGIPCGQAIADYAADHLSPAQSDDLQRLLRLSHEAVRELLYLPAFARKPLYFRRLRLPSQLSVYWDHVLVTHAMRKLLRCLVGEGEASVAQGWAALEKVRAMRRLAREAALPDQGLDLMEATFEVLALAREYYFRPFTPEVVHRLQEAKAQYQARFPERYRIHLDFSAMRMKRRALRALLALLLREGRSYRLLDRLVLVRLLAVLYPLVRRLPGGAGPRFARRQAMGLDAVFR